MDTAWPQTLPTQAGHLFPNLLCSATFPASHLVEKLNACCERTADATLWKLLVLLLNFPRYSLADECSQGSSIT